MNVFQKLANDQTFRIPYQLPPEKKINTMVDKLRCKQYKHNFVLEYYLRHIFLQMNLILYSQMPTGNNMLSTIIESI
jgi:hypothetical protein